MKRVFVPGFIENGTKKRLTEDLLNRNNIDNLVDATVKLNFNPVEKEVVILQHPFPHYSFPEYLHSHYNDVVLIQIIRDTLICLSSYKLSTYSEKSWRWILKYSGLFLNSSMTKGYYIKEEFFLESKKSTEKEFWDEFESSGDSERLSLIEDHMFISLNFSESNGVMKLDKFMFNLKFK